MARSGCRAHPRFETSPDEDELTGQATGRVRAARGGVPRAPPPVRMAMGGVLGPIGERGFENRLELPALLKKNLQENSYVATL